MDDFKIHCKKELDKVVDVFLNKAFENTGVKKGSVQYVETRRAFMAGMLTMIIGIRDFSHAITNGKFSVEAAAQFLNEIESLIYEEIQSKLKNN